MKILCVFGRHNYGQPSRGTGYEYANFIPALEALGHEVVFFESFDRAAWSDFPTLNRALLELALREQPEVALFVLMGYEVWAETLDLLRAPGGPALMNWSTDDSWKYEQFSRLVAPHFDLYVTTAQSALAKARRDGLEHVVLSQWAANGQALAEPLPSDRCEFDVSFVGSAYGSRPRWIQGLRTRGIEVECFGHGWPRGPVAAHDVPRIYRHSRISLNFSDAPALLRTGTGAQRSRQIKARVFEVPGAGGFLLTQAVLGLEEYYRAGEEIAVFEDLGELESKIRRYLGDGKQRDALARRGFARTREEHTYERRFLPLLNAALERRPWRAATTASGQFEVDWLRFEHAVASHAVGPALRLARRALVAPLRAFWGPVRGPRAARRLLFELSWRIAGERTYSAAGLPGRLFYAQS
ncbi:MAG TPA: glycosyltransferase [Burkholderiaceae bacterium]|nr:glycosyltransferase [Burkholderiaceae bacterium]